jgi:hypothetical protein
MIQVDFAFPHRYEIKEPPELPGAGQNSLPVYYFPRLGVRPERDGHWVQVVPASGLPWLGVFRGSRYTFSRLLSTPKPDQFCVVAEGQGYLVHAASPDEWQEIDMAPITSARPVAESGLLILTTFHMLAALGVAGLAWKSPRVCWDDLCISRADSERIEGTGHDPTSESAQMRFSVDTKTGDSLIAAPRSMDGRPFW